MRYALIVLFAFPLYAQTTPQEWFNTAATHYGSGDYAGALAAYEKARKLNYANPNQVSVRLARTYAKLGRKDEAFAELTRATAAGFSQPDLLNADDELLALRGDKRFKEVVAATVKNQKPCLASPEYRQFDYWLGEWDVLAQGNKVASSSIQLILDECVIFENYETLTHYSGKSFSIWDAATKQWQQRYVDSGGAFHTWIGGLENGQMRFLWKHDVRGTPTIDRMTYIREDADRVRQLIDTSTDDGKTWTTTFDGLYVRRK
jgi:tetratricopeptide (TPR) repeat protein